MPKGSDWKKSTTYMFDGELVDFWKAFQQLRKWGMFYTYYMDELGGNVIQNFLVYEMDRRNMWDFEKHEPKPGYGDYVR